MAGLQGGTCALGNQTCPLPGVKQFSTPFCYAGWIICSSWNPTFHFSLALVQWMWGSVHVRVVRDPRCDAQL